VESQDALHLGNGLRILEGSGVDRGHDFLRERPVEMRTPIGYDAIAALLKRDVPPPAIADDEWKGDSIGTVLALR
jgi:hypothetical protein